MRLTLAATGLLILAAGPTLAVQAPPALSTFSIGACDTASGFCGVAVQS